MYISTSEYLSKVIKNSTMKRKLYFLFITALFKTPKDFRKPHLLIFDLNVSIPALCFSCPSGSTLTFGWKSRQPRDPIILHHYVLLCRLCHALYAYIQLCSVHMNKLSLLSKLHPPVWPFLSSSLSTGTAHSHTTLFLINFLVSLLSSVIHSSLPQLQPKNNIQCLCYWCYI